jgi:TRAP transporter TAXI family solute receptor
MGDVAVDGFKGLTKFKGKKHDILSMAIMYPNLLQVVTLKKYGITNIEQIKGKKISSGSPGSGTNFMAEAVFEALGIPKDSYKDSRLSFTESANALRDGTIEVGVWSVGPGTSSILDQFHTRTAKENFGYPKRIFGGGSGRRCVPRGGQGRTDHRCVERDDLSNGSEHRPGL